MPLTVEEREFLSKAGAGATLIEEFDEGREVTATGPVFMSWLRYAFAAGMKHERSRPKPRRRRLRIYSRKRRVISLRFK